MYATFPKFQKSFQLLAVNPRERPRSNPSPKDPAKAGTYGASRDATGQRERESKCRAATGFTPLETQPSQIITNYSKAKPPYGLDSFYKKASVKFLTGFTPLEAQPGRRAIDGFNAKSPIGSLICHSKFNFRLLTGFTLLEILIVSGIIAVIGAIVVMVINPQEYLKRARDSARMSDLSTIHNVLSWHEASGAASFGEANKIYVSVPDDASSTCGSLGLPPLPSGWTYRCAPTNTYRKPDGTGWIPVNLLEFPGGQPIASLPIDPVNTTSSGSYYTYVTGGSWELTAKMEADKNKKQGPAGNDGGKSSLIFEFGNNLNLTPAEALGRGSTYEELTTQENALVGYWSFNEGSGTTANDSSGNGNNGTLVDGPVWTTGKVGGALTLDGLNDRVQDIPSDPFEYRGDDFTMMIWFKPHSDDIDLGRIISKPWNGSGQYNYKLESNLDDTLRVFLTGSTSWGSGSTPTVLNTGAYHHLAVTLIGSTKAVNIYINGTLSRSDTHNITGWTPSSGDLNKYLTLGSLYPYGSGWAGTTTFCVKGDIDEPRIYNRALSAAEIAAIYNATK